MAMVEALMPEALESHKILFFDNVDAKSFFRKLEHVKNPKRTMWMLISKSGTTIETLTQAEFVDQWLAKNHKVHLADTAVVITEFRSSALYDWAQENKIPVLQVPVTVGGRFSALTPVGLFPLAMLGVDIKGLVKGAELVFKEVLLVKELTAQFSMSFERGEPTTSFFYYCDDLRYWGQWIQQLWAESLGKKQTIAKKKAPPVSVPYSCRGSTDQHSVLQQIAEGTQKKFACFLRVEEAEKFGEKLSTQLFDEKSLLTGKGLGELLMAEAIATQQALNEADVHSLTLLTEKLTPESLGFLMMLMELTVGALGTLYEINPFDQPGVERGKVLARTILSR
jgi:glucose-6-phosphate isomerase